MAPGNKALGGVSLPLAKDPKRAGELPHQPAILPRQPVIRDSSQLQSVAGDPTSDRGELIALRAEVHSLRATCDEHRRKDSSASRTVETARSEAHIANWKMNIALGLTTLTFGTIVAGFVFLFNRQESAGAEAILAAKNEARNVMLEQRESMLNTLRAERDEASRLTAKRVIEEQSRIFARAKDPDVVTVHP